MARLLAAREGRLLEVRLSYLFNMVEASAIDFGHEKHPQFCVLDYGCGQEKVLWFCSILYFGTLISEYLGC